MNVPNISIYSNVLQNKSSNTIAIDFFLEGIQNGKWQDIVLPLRVITDEAQRSAAKKKAPCVTIAGEFNQRTDSGLVKHSGFIAIDIDDVDDINELKSLLCVDPHVYACFTSISGRGLCLLYVINPLKHRESFQGISEYLYDKHKVIADPTSINVSRLRFVSYDPDLYVNEKAIKWTEYPKSKPPKKVQKVIFAKNDFENIIAQIQGKRINLCENYHEWLRIGFSLADHFGESGRGYFHNVSQFSSKYDGNVTDRQYTACMKANGSNKNSIATFYYYCKQAGIEVYSERTKRVANAAASQKKAGSSAEATVQSLGKFLDIKGDDVIKLVEQVRENNVELKEDSEQERLEQWLASTRSFKRNRVNRIIYMDGKRMENENFNDLWREANKVVGKTSIDSILRTVNSGFTPTYDPFQDYFKKHAGKGQIERRILNENDDNPESSIIYGEYVTPNIDRFFGSINTDKPELLLHFGKKWLVGIISAMHGIHSPLFLVLSGGRQGSGKTRFFRDLLPTDLKEYYAQSKLDAGKDDEILMTQMLIIMDDEMGGKTKVEEARLKQLTSADKFNLREPYGKANVELKRLAVLCGTTNSTEILTDPTGNRRFIPISVNSINFEVENSVDRDELFMEAYNLYNTGFDWEVKGNDIDYLGSQNEKFDTPVIEGEMLVKYFDKGDTPMTTTEIMNFIKNANPGIFVSVKKMGEQLTRRGFDKKTVRIHNVPLKCWLVRERAFDEPYKDSKTEIKPDFDTDEMPF